MCNKASQEWLAMTVVSSPQRLSPQLPFSGTQPQSAQPDSPDPEHPQSDPSHPYDPEALTQQFRGRYGLMLRRILAIVLPFLQLLLWVRWDRLWKQETRNRRHQAVRLREILTRLGPAFIKIGQALSTRPDLVSPLFLEELTKLQDELPPFSNDIAFQLIEAELGAPPSQIYRELSPNPVAAASLGQVYQGVLHSGEKVAVKVQRPDLLDSIAIDLYLVRRGMGWLKRHFKQIRSDLVAIVDEFGTKLYEEMDYRQEGRNAETFSRLYRHPLLYTPQIYWSYTSGRILTMEWIDGIKLTQLDRIKAAGLNSHQLIEIGVNSSLKQLLEHGFFHADPHPGNLLAMMDGRLAYIDFGMMSTLKPQHRYGLLKAIVHLVNRDFSALAQDYVELEFLKADTDLTPIIPALSHVFAEAMGATVSEMNFKSITDKLSGVMYEYPFRVPAYYALIIRSLLTLEGIAIGIDPNFKVLSVAYPYVASRILSDPAPELREALRDLLFNQGQFRWTRLENLLRNAANSEEFQLEQSLEKALDFVFSERGTFLREKLADVIFQATSPGRLTPSGQEGSTPGAVTDSTAHLQRIWQLLTENPSFQPLELLPVMAKTLTRPEAQQLGQELASRWLQRSAARFIRQIFVPNEPSPSFRRSA